MYFRRAVRQAPTNPPGPAPVLLLVLPDLDPWVPPWRRAGDPESGRDAAAAPLLPKDRASQGDLSATVFIWKLESRSGGKAGVKPENAQGWLNLTEPQNGLSLSIGPKFGPGSLTKEFCRSSVLYSRLVQKGGGEGGKTFSLPQTCPFLEAQLKLISIPTAHCKTQGRPGLGVANIPTSARLLEVPQKKIRFLATKPTNSHSLGLGDRLASAFPGRKKEGSKITN